MKLSIVSTLLVLSGFSAHAGGLTDANITEIMKTANQGEVDAGKLAKHRAENTEVKAFAEKMVTEHKENEKEVKKVAKKQDLKMDDSDTSKKLEKDAKNKISELKKHKKADFDRAYITSQVEMHQALLTELENNLIPAAQNPELKKYLEDTKGHVSMHLEEAKALQAKLQ